MWSSLLAVALATIPAAEAFPQMRALVELASQTKAVERDIVVGTSPVHTILQRQNSAVGDGATYTPPGAKDSEACGKDKCCIWSYIAADMAAAFTDGNQCSNLARGAIRLGFHDAGAWNSSLPSGGADGSILLSGELSRPENRGLEPIAARTTAWFETYKPYGISMADLIQFGANVATVVCPQGPRIKTFVGRADSTAQPPQGLLPSPQDNARALLELFGAKTFSPAELVALMGAHSVSRQRFANPRQAGAPQDSTPGVMDTTYYAETSAQRPPAGVVRFPSDVSLARDAATSATWQSFSGTANQAPWAAVC